MPKPEIYGETLYFRVPRGTRARIEQAIRPGEKAADVLRRLLLVELDRESRVKRSPGRHQAALKQERDELAETLAKIRAYDPKIEAKAKIWVAEVDRPRRR